MCVPIPPLAHRLNPLIFGFPLQTKCKSLEIGQQLNAVLPLDYRGDAIRQSSPVC